MKTIKSVLYWFLGTVFFLSYAFIFVLLFIFFSRPILYPIVRKLFYIQLVIMGVKPVFKGLERFDQNKSFLIMGNHESLFDAFLIPSAIPMHIVAVEAAYHFSMPVWGYLVKKWGCIPIHRHNLEQAKYDLEKAQKTLLNGTSVLVLPEGHRTLDGNIAPFKKGPFHIALKANADILPFAITGLFYYKNKNSWKLNPTKAIVQFGTPIKFKVFQNWNEEKLRLFMQKTVENLKQEAIKYSNIN